jgi:hypothetical protein
LPYSDAHERYLAIYSRRCLKFNARFSSRKRRCTENTTAYGGFPYFPSELKIVPIIEDNFDGTEGVPARGGQKWPVDNIGRKHCIAVKENTAISKP